MKNQATDKITAFYHRGSDNSNIAYERQKKDLVDYMYDNKIENFKFYEDVGSSKRILKPPAFRKMCADIKKGKINTIVVSSIDRIGQNPTKVHKWLCETAVKGAEVVVLDKSTVLDLPYNPTKK